MAVDFSDPRLLPVALGNTVVLVIRFVARFLVVLIAIFVGASAPIAAKSLIHNRKRKSRPHDKGGFPVTQHNLPYYIVKSLSPSMIFSSIFSVFSTGECMISWVL